MPRAHSARIWAKRAIATGGGESHDPRSPRRRRPLSVSTPAARRLRRSAKSARRSASTAAESPSTNWGRFALVGLGTTIAAVLANTLFYYVGGALVAYDPEFVILATPGGTVFMTFVPAVVAVLLYAALLRFTRRATRVFSIVAAVVLVVSFVPDFTYVPTVPGSSNPQIAILLAMHVIAAAVIVRMLTTTDSQA